MKQLFVGGKFADSSTGKSFAVVNPATEQPVDQVAEGDARDVDAAVTGARKALESGKWSTMGPSDRARLMFKAADIMESKLDEFVQLETANTGKTLIESKIELSLSLEVLRYYAGWATKATGETIPSRPNSFLFTV